MDESQVPKSVEDAIYRYVRADLQPSRFVVHAKIGGSVGLGGLMSLFLCGQLGFGLSSLAMAVHAGMMDVAGFFGCTAVCGVLFAVVPVLSLRAISTGIQFRLLIQREWRAIAGWTVAFGGVLAYRNDRADQLWVLLMWSVVAIGSFELLGRLLHRASTLFARNAIRQT
jgi:hypothetical protein